MGAGEATLRATGRAFDELRKVEIKTNYMKFAEGSVLICMGDTHVICTATIEDRVAPFLIGTGKGWITGEYSMLPRSSKKRIPRESVAGKVGGRTHEIQRLIGRSLRAVFDLKALGERTVLVDCDVVQADGGTRTASITGSFIAVYLALEELRKTGAIARVPMIDTVAAVSVGVIGGRPALDLDYSEDSGAEVDMNVVMTGSGKFVEVQGTAEGDPFTQEDFLAMTGLANKGILELSSIQKKILGLS